MPVVDDEVVRFDGLCPSTDLPSAAWQFDYTVYSDSACTAGNELTTGASPTLTCFDASDLATRSHPIQHAGGGHTPPA